MFILLYGLYALVVALFVVAGMLPIWIGVLIGLAPIAIWLVIIVAVFGFAWFALGNNRW